MADEEEVIDDLEIEEIEDDATDVDIPVVAERERRSPCPKHDRGHKAIPNPKKRGPYDHDYVCAYCGKHDWTGKELEELIADVLLKNDSNRELCRTCLELAKEAPVPDEPWLQKQMELPYGEETGNVEWKLQLRNGEAQLDVDGNPLYAAFPELICKKGHRWYFSEGTRRDIRGLNPILFESHLYHRKRRELLAAEGVVDPAYTMDRWGKRPTQGLYGRAHPLGRKINSAKQRKDGGSGFYK